MGNQEPAHTHITTLNTGMHVNTNHQIVGTAINWSGLVVRLELEHRRWLRSSDLFANLKTFHCCMRGKGIQWTLINYAQRVLPCWTQKKKKRVLPMRVKARLEAARHLAGIRLSGSNLLHPSLQQLWFIYTVHKCLCPQQLMKQQSGSHHCPSQYIIILIVVLLL